MSSIFHAVFIFSLLSNISQFNHWASYWDAFSCYHIFLFISYIFILARLEQAIAAFLSISSLEEEAFWRASSRKIMHTMCSFFFFNFPFQSFLFIFPIRNPPFLPYSLLFLLPLSFLLFLFFSLPFIIGLNKNKNLKNIVLSMVCCLFVSKLYMKATGCFHWSKTRNAICWKLKYL